MSPKESIMGFFVVIVTVVIVGVLLALPTMLLWNLVMPDVFGLPMVNFWQALFLSLLGRCLFGTFKIGGDKK